MSYSADLSISNQLQSGVLGNMEWVGAKIPCNENAIHNSLVVTRPVIHQLTLSVAVNFSQQNLVLN